MAVHIYNISAMLLRSETPEYLVHITASELHLDGSILKNAKSLLVTLNLLSAEIKVLRHAEQPRETRLAEFCFGISMETILVAQGPLSVEVCFVNLNIMFLNKLIHFQKLEVIMTHSSAVINAGFYTLQNSKSSDSKNVVISQYYSDEKDIFQRLLPIIPKVSKF